jgi:hypothetical protein
VSPVSDSPAAILRSIERLYRELRPAMPREERRRREREIRALSEQFKAANTMIVLTWLTTTDDDASYARMVSGDRSVMETPRRRAS